MIQRLQTLFFLLAAICFGAEFAVPFATASKSAAGFFVDSRYEVLDHPALMILAGLGALLSVVAIFMYRHRKNQIKTGYIITTLAILLPVVALLLMMSDPADENTITDQAGTYLPLGMILFSVLAVRFTKKDEKLVKSMDRLR